MELGLPAVSGTGEGETGVGSALPGRCHLRSLLPSPRPTKIPRPILSSSATAFLQHTPILSPSYAHFSKHLECFLKAGHCARRWAVAMGMSTSRILWDWDSVLSFRAPPST